MDLVFPIGLCLLATLMHPGEAHMTDAAADLSINMATKLLKSLQMRPFCDHTDTDQLTPEQMAAVHAFMHEMLAAYYRMTIIVPAGLSLEVLNKRFAKAAKIKA